MDMITGPLGYALASLGGVELWLVRSRDRAVLARGKIVSAGRTRRANDSPA